MSGPGKQGKQKLQPDFNQSSEYLPAAHPEWLARLMGEPGRQGQVESDGCSINYFEWGERRNPPLILLHGFLAHAGCWAAIAPSLAADRHVVAYDLSGMGDSGRREAYTVEARVAELLAVARHTGQFDHDAKPVIIAHSYGGSIALAAMKQHHEVFAGAVICDLMAMRPERLAKYFDRNRRPGSQDPDRPNKIYPDYETARGRYVLSPPQEVGAIYLLDYMAYHSLTKVDKGWRWKFDPEVFRRDAKTEKGWGRQSERIVEAPGRKAVIHGEHSLLFDADSAAYLRELGGADFPIISIPQAKHHLMLDQPIALISALRSVLENWTAADRKVIEA